MLVTMRGKRTSECVVGAMLQSGTHAWHMGSMQARTSRGHAKEGERVTKRSCC